MRANRSFLLLPVFVTGMYPEQAFAAAGQPHGMGILLLKSVISLAVVLALFALIIWGMRRLQFGLASKGIRTLSVENRTSLDARNSLVIVRHGNRRWLLGISPAGINRIDRLPETSEVTVDPDGNAL